MSSIDKNESVTFHGDAKYKKALVESMREHIKLDHLTRGTFGVNNTPIDEFRGCAVGCAVTSIKHLYSKGNFPIDVSKTSVSDHSGLADALGLSGNVWLTRAYEDFFENIPGDDHIQWSVDFLEAIPVGISPERIRAVYHRFTSHVLSESLDIKSLNDEGRDAINQVKDLHDRAAKGDNPVDKERAAALAAARDAALTVVGSAWCAVLAAELAAWTVSNAVLNEIQESWFAWNAVGVEKIQHYAETLLKLLRESGS